MKKVAAMLKAFMLKNIPQRLKKKAHSVAYKLEHMKPHMMA
jgi:hypothetical protein